MPSRSLRMWKASARKALDEIEAAHRAVRSLRQGRRYAAQQMSQAYVVFLSSQFQRFCRDLHSECVRHLVAQPSLQPYESILHPRFVEGRKLDSGNPNPGNIGSDFGRFGINLWDAVRSRDPRNEVRQRSLETLMQWRNAIAHQDFSHSRFGGRENVRLSDVRQWRSACERLAVDIEGVMYAYLLRITGSAPW